MQTISETPLMLYTHNYPNQPELVETRLQLAKFDLFMRYIL